MKSRNSSTATVSNRLVITERRSIVWHLLVPRTSVLYIVYCREVIRMSAKPNKSKPEVRVLSRLKTFPLQAEVFGKLNAPDLEALADDIERNGLRDLIEVLPKNSVGIPPDTIISGHQRRSALRKLGKTEAKVLIRYDLAAASREEIDRVFIEANVNRRQLDPLEKARAVLKLYESLRGRPVNTNNWSDVNDARDHVGKMIGMSGRNLQRYWHVLQAPHEVQEAFRRGEITLVEASRIGLLDVYVKNELAEEIRNGKDPREVVRRQLNTLPGQKPRYISSYRLIPKFRSALKKVTEAVEIMSFIAPDLPMCNVDLKTRVEAISGKMKRISRMIAKKLSANVSNGELKQTAGETKGSECETKPPEAN